MLKTIYTAEYEKYFFKIITHKHHNHSRVVSVLPRKIGLRSCLSLSVEKNKEEWNKWF